ncbi:hypothetical protein PG984_015183 [Apiospora sp. TS-2023a]
MSDYVPQWPERELEDPAETSYPAAYPEFIPALENGLRLNYSYQHNYHYNHHYNPHQYNPHYNHPYNYEVTNAAFRPQRAPAAQHPHGTGSGARALSSSTNPTRGVSTPTNSSWEVIGNTQGGNGEDIDSRFGGDESHIDESSILSTHQPGREFACPFQLHARHRAPPHTASDYDRWYMMWDILFPHDARPAEPYSGSTLPATSVPATSIPATSIPATPSSETSFGAIAFGFLQQGGGIRLIQTRFPNGAPPGFFETTHQILEDYTKVMVEYAEQQNRSDPP